MTTNEEKSKQIKMTTDEEKTKIAKLLTNIEIPETKLTERCSDLVQEFHKRYDDVVNEEEDGAIEEEKFENPYVVNKTLLEETERKLKALLAEDKRARRRQADGSSVFNNDDPQRPWRTNSSKEKLLRIDNELKRHHEKSSDEILPLSEDEMKALVKDCLEGGDFVAPVGAVRLRETFDDAKKNLPNFKYNKIDNSTAIAILAEAHQEDKHDNVPDKSEINLE